MANHGGLDHEWALGELRTFLQLTDLQRPPRTPGVIDMTGRLDNAGPPDQILASAQVVEQILVRVLPEWTPPSVLNKQNRWIPYREAVQRCIAQLERGEEVAARLGDTAPRLSAGTMHPWIWDAARSLWGSGHRAEAVRAASVKVNAETQNKASIRDRSETTLFNVVFHTSRVPTASNPRFVLPGDDGGTTSESVRRGVRAFAEGCFAALRNPLSHEETELSEAEALEQLAAFSILARWVENSEVRSV